MRLRNLNGTGENTCGCGSWLTHWEKHAETIGLMCSVAGCGQVAEVGAHVQREGLLAGDEWFIVPLCPRHNAARGATIVVHDDTILVPANVADTCG